jgi:KaiC domain protein
MSDDDWFERALRESDAEAAEESNGGDEERPADEGPDAVDDAVAGDDVPTAAGPAGEFDAEPDDRGDDAFGSFDASAEDGPFDQDFASAFESAPGPSGDGPAEDEPLGESFDDDASFESAIPRIDLGIGGLDDMILGGVPTRSLISVIGSAGTGKTTFGLQFLEESLSEGGRAVYLTLEEESGRILDTAEEKNWPFGTYAEEGRLAVVHLDPIEMANSLASIRSELPELVEEFDADRLVLDSVSLLEMMYDHPSERRSEVYQFTRSLKQAGVTTLVTSEASAENPYNSRYGIIEYLADAVFVLQYVRPSDFQETRLAVEIQKIRDANHSRQTKPYEISDEGLRVYQRANIF